MTSDKFAEIDIELSDDVLTQLNELAVTMPYIKRSVITHYTDNISVPLESTIDKFIKDYNGTMSIVRIMPACHLIWHKDIHTERKCVINIPLKDYTDQVTYITDKDIRKSFENRNTYTDLDFNEPIHRSYVVPYKFKKLYFLNVSEKYHCVFNLTDEYRYLLSIQTGKLSYQEGVDYFNNLGLIANQ